MSYDIESEQKIKELLRGLQIKRREILAMPPEKALDSILKEKQPLPLVHSFPEEDFYFLIYDIGVEDCPELLEMASDRQWEYILDRDIWYRDRILLPEITRWLQFFMNAAPERTIRWTVEKKAEFLEYYLFRSIDVAVREHDQDPADLGEDFQTCDDVFYYRLKSPPPEADKELIADRDSFVNDFIRRLSLYDHILYQTVLLKAVHVIPAESEEEMYRLRNVRLAEKGFLSFEEAVGIYQPMKPEVFLRQKGRFAKIIPKEESSAPVPYFSSSLHESSLFSRALENIAHEPAGEHLQSEFAGLCNQVISADRRVIRSRDELKHIVRKVSGYLSMGISLLLGEDRPSPQKAAALIRTYAIAQIFRVGYSRVAELKWQAEKWRKESWFEKQGFDATFWGEEWLGVLGGLLIEKPLFFDNYESGVLYRDFYSLDDVRHTRKTLERIMTADTLLSQIRIPAETVQDRFVIWKSFLLTPWLRHYLGKREQQMPVDMDDFRIFYRKLWQEEKGGRRIRNSMKESFLHWVAERCGKDVREIPEPWRNLLVYLFAEVEKEYAAVSEEDLDARYIMLFHVI
ncbi:MAG: DUF6178 family protein [Desulfococcaceae bacterium]|jgi:hypothetical protein|nr:DUF6178 family protein [Desulfococcaceae bacterium]